MKVIVNFYHSKSIKYNLKKTDLDWIMEKVKDIFFYDDYVEVEF